MIETRVIDGQRMLNLKDMASNAAGYFVTLDGKKVYSTKRDKAVQINGSKTLNGVHYFKFSNNGWSWNYTMNEIQDFLERNRKSIESIPVIKNEGVSNVRAFTLARQRVGQPMELFHSHNPIMYRVEPDARAAAEKVAISEPGVKILVLQIMGEVVAGGVNWK